MSVRNARSVELGQAIHITVPATSANLGPGFDALGLALDWHDEVEVRLTSEGVEVTVEGEGAGDLPHDASHLVVRAMRAAFSALDTEAPGMALRCVNAIPQARGLGSSAAAIVAGVLAARALTPDAAVDLDPLAIAAELEGHADNVAPCLLGGATVAWRSDARVRAERLDIHPEIRPVVYVPETAVLTEAARGVLPETVPFADATQNTARAALLVEALANRPELLFDATADRLHQQYRRSVIPQAMALVDQLRDERWPAVVSGAGPSVLVLCTGDELPASADGWHQRPLGVDLRGATVVPVPAGNAHEGYDPVSIGHED
jgi:homoserine kinase